MKMQRNVFRLSAGLLVAGLLAAAIGCSLQLPVSGSGTLTRSTYSVAGFSGIQASDAFTVHVVPDTVYSVSITCDSNLVRYLVVRHDGNGTLRLGLIQGYSYFGVTLIAEVHMPVVHSIDASGASTVRLDPGFSSLQAITVVLSGASQCDLPTVAFGDISFDLSGASFVSCTGSAAFLSITVSGASRANVLNCSGTRAHVNISGASEAWVDVGTHSLDLNASGASSYYYGGNPTILSQSLSGGSRMVRVR